MPEGDTIHFASRRIRGVLEGHVPDEILTPHPRFARAGWPERLAGRGVTSVEARGKHLLLHFAGGLVIHSHLRMHGTWRVLHDSGGAGCGEDRAPSPRRDHSSGRPDARGRRAWGGAWLVVRRGGWLVVQRHGPVLELMSSARLRLDPRLTQLGPDIVGQASFDRERVLLRLRGEDPQRPIGDALLDQRTVAGIGNFWKVEGCFLAAVDPWRPVVEVSDDEVLAILDGLRPRMQASAADGRQSRFRQIYGRGGSFCPRCGPPARIVVRHQGDDNRVTYWCASCQR
jgi:endonuclease-8